MPLESVAYSRTGIFQRGDQWCLLFIKRRSDTGTAAIKLYSWMSGNHWVFVCATKATSHGASKEHNELSARLSLHLQWGGGIAAHLVCCHGTTLLLFLQPTAARGLGSSEGLIVQSHAGSTCSQTGWHSYQSLIFKTNIFTRFHWFWFL